MAQHDRSDPNYRSFFAHPRMIEDLLWEIVDERWLERIDFGSGERVDASFVTPKHENHESDVVWRFRRKDGGEPVHLYILLKLEWWSDPFMLVRLMAYESLLYKRLLANQSAGGRERLPRVISVVAFLIDEMDPSTDLCLPSFRYWVVDKGSFPRKELTAPFNPMADLHRIEKARDCWEVRWSAHRLRFLFFMRPVDVSLRQAFENWMQKVILPRFGLSPEDVSGELTLEEIADLLEKWASRRGESLAGSGD